MWLNPSAFAQSSARHIWKRRPCATSWDRERVTIDMGLTRAFRIRENHTIEFRAEVFNMPNHLNPGNPILILSN